MKKLMLSTALVMALGQTAHAQTATDDMFRPTADAGQFRASDFIGKRIYAADDAAEMTEYDGVQANWNDIGEVNDVLITRDGEIAAVLVDIGGFLGMGERQVAVSMPSISFVADSSTADMPDDFFLVMTADRATLEGAPQFTWQDGAVPDGAAAEPAAEAEAANTESTEGGADGGDTATSDVAADGAAQEETAASDTAMAETPAADASDTAMTRDPVQVEGYAALPADAVSAEDLTGASVYDVSDERIGEVSEPVVDGSGKLTHAVVDVGGFLGMGEKPVLLPIGDMDILRQEGGGDVRIYLAMSKENLEQLPTYSK